MNCVDMGHITGLMESFTKVIGRIARQMEKEFIFGVMVIGMKAIF